MKPSAHILILNYNGKGILEEFLPSFQKALTRSSYACKLSVIDNQSRDGSVEFLKSNFPDVGLFIPDQNRVLCSYNVVARQVSEDVLIFMNNDIRVDENFIDPLVRPFDVGSDIFFVTPKCLSMKDNSYEGNKTRARLRWGVFWSTAMYPGHENEIGSTGPTFSGGFGAIDRKKFLALDGYDDLYLPGRLEDSDLCFRAAKRGWRNLYEPKSVVYHKGGVSFHKEFGVQKTLVINWRNTFLFMAKNLSQPKLMLEAVVLLPLRLLYSLLSGKPELFIGFFQALPRIPGALIRRRKLKSQGFFRRVTDQAIFEQV